MKSILTTSLLLVTISNCLLSQTGASDNDPFQGNYKLGGSDEIILVWGTNTFNKDSVFQKVYGYTGIPFQDGEIEAKDTQFQTGETGFARSKQVDVITGDFNCDSFDDVAAAWIGPDTSVIVMIPEISSASLNWSEASTAKIKGEGISLHPRANNQIRLAAGYFDADPETEFVLAYWTADETIRLVLFETDAFLTLQEMTSIAEVPLPLSTLGNEIRFDIATGDFDGDVDDEIVLVWWAPDADETGKWGIMAKVYDYEANGGLVSRVEDAIYLHVNNIFYSDHFLNRLVVAAGDFNDDTIDEAVFGYQLAESDKPTLVYLQPFQFADDTLTAEEDLIESIVIDPNNQVEQNRTLGNRGWPMSIVTGDLDGDGRDEILSAAVTELKIYASNDTLGLTRIGSGNLASSQPGEDTHRTIALSDFNAEISLDGRWIPEIVVAENLEINPGIDPDGELLIRVFEPDLTIENGVLTSVTLVLRASLRDEMTDPSAPRPLAVATGDFDGNSIRVGQPRRFSKTEILQPLVLLNAPPTHFDIFDGEIFDISLCHNENDCQFAASYETETEKSVEVKTQVNADWATSASVSGGGSFLGIGVEAKVTATYGERFSKSQARRETFTVTQSISAIFDDWVYATVVDYDIWEYPVLTDQGEQGQIVVVVPNLQTRAWFPSKSPTASSYLPAHEVGNIFSYQEIVNSPAENTALAEQVRWSTGDRVTLNDNTVFNWALTAENETETTTERAVERSIGAELDFDIPVPFVPNVGLSGEYSDATLSTHSTSVRDQKGLSVHFDAIDFTHGETFYNVTPYAYWAKTGALVLDYAVKPELSGQGGVNTWWQDRYGNKPDLALILPWRHDPEKGNSVSDVKRQETRSLLFNPAEPNPGDQVRITARIHNFSLVPLFDAVEVSFYSGDPDSGGVLITNTEITGGIDARSNKNIDVNWTVPSDIEARFSRIYVVLDPADNVDEIHENNNRGWRPLVNTGDVTSVTGGDTEIRTFELSQNYPNPFNPTTTINFSIPEAGVVSLKVYDILGREVLTLLNEIRPAGSHRVNLDADGLSSGIYFYTLKSGHFVSTKKLLFIK